MPMKKCPANCKIQILLSHRNGIYSVIILLSLVDTRHKDNNNDNSCFELLTDVFISGIEGR